MKDVVKTTTVLEWWLAQMHGFYHWKWVNGFTRHKGNLWWRGTWEEGVGSDFPQGLQQAGETFATVWTVQMKAQWRNVANQNHPTIGMVYATHLGPFSILVCIILGSCYCWIYLIILIQINSECISWVVLISKRVVGGLFVQFWGTKCRCALATLQEALRLFIVGNVPYSLRHALHNKSSAQIYRDSVE